MALDGEKLRRLRLSKGMSQEKLAAMANVNKRTVQRAEEGVAIALESAAFIADALGVAVLSVQSARQQEVVTEGPSDAVVLVPATSGRKIIDALRQSFEAEVTYDVEPTKANLGPLAALASILERFIPDPWAVPHDRTDWAAAEVLENQASVNELLPVLAGMGINVFLGSYTAARKPVFYNMDEGHMYEPRNAKFGPEPFAYVVVSDTSASHLLRLPGDQYREDVGSDEIPF